jgi:hypothetical protein
LFIGIGVYVLFWPTIVLLILAVSFGYWVPGRHPRDDLEITGS